MTTAIIGSGISGLGCAYRLAKAGESVTVFESADIIGGHTATKRVSVASGKYDVDTGFIVYNEHNEECFSFGKYKGQTVVSVLQSNPGYFSWIQQADFPLYTKKVLTQIKLRDF